jgi:hypothetical protein
VLCPLDGFQIHSLLHHLPKGTATHHTANLHYYMQENKKSKMHQNTVNRDCSTREKKNNSIINNNTQRTKRATCCISITQVTETVTHDKANYNSQEKKKSGIS